MNYTINIPRSIFAGLLNFCSNDETRRVLYGIFVEVAKKTEEDARVLLTATDGRTLGHYKFENAKFSGDIGPTDQHSFILDFRPIVRFFDDEDNINMLHLVVTGAGAITVEATNLPQICTVTAFAIPGKYPNYNAVFPSDPPAPIIWGFDFGLLSKFARAAEIITCRHNAELSVVGHLQPGQDCVKDQDCIGAYSVFFSDANFRGALMPRRSEVIKRHFPEFAETA